jgi:3-oxoacyl-[acyl-carrier protein] reductase
MTEKRLDGKVAIVTGSSRGIGKAIAERFAAEGAKVTVNWVGKEREAQAVVDSINKSGGEALSVRADVSKSSDVKGLVRATLDKFGRVDILVNNAGVMFTKSVLDTTEEEWDRTIDVNLKGAYLCSKEVAPVMLRQEAGKIIMMSSNSGLYHPSAMRFTEYVTSKAGMNGLTKALALALGPHITVNAICPGWIKTDMIADTDPEIIIAGAQRYAQAEQMRLARRGEEPQFTAMAKNWLHRRRWNDPPPPGGSVIDENGNTVRERGAAPRRGNSLDEIIMEELENERRQPSD